MADPLSITASASTEVTAAIQSIKSLRNTLQESKTRNKTLRRLQTELQDLLHILEKLEEVGSLEASVLSLLESPISRCTQLCRDFESSMQEFSGKSKLSFLDWTKMEFMRGDIDEFMDLLAMYKSTISVCLGSIIMKNSKLSQRTIEEHGEAIQDATYDLNMHLQRVDEKLALLTERSAESPDVDLKDEGSVTDQCLRICDDAYSLFGSLTDQKTPAKSQAVVEPATDTRQFEAQLLAHKAQDDYRKHLVEIIGSIQNRLDSLALDKEPVSDQERLRLEKELEAVEQCLEVCNRASSKTSHQMIYDGNSGSGLANTMSDLFDARKSLLRGRLPLLIGSISDESLQKVSAGRYARLLGSTTAGETDADHSTSPPEMKKASEIMDELLQELPQLSTENIADGSGEDLSGRLSIPETQIREETPEVSGLQENSVVIEDNKQETSATADNLEDGNDSIDSDILSNGSSLWDAQTWELSSATSGPPHGITRLSMQELSDVVLEHTELARTLKASVSHPSLQPEVVLEEFKRLMRCYYRDLGSTSNASEYKPVSQLLNRSRGIIINNARKLLGLAHNNLLFPDQRAKMSRQAKNEMLYYLWQLTTGVPNKQNTAPLPGPIGDADTSQDIIEENDSDDDSSLGGDLYPEISAAIAFLKDGIPMQNFQEEMRRFVLNAAWDYNTLKSSTALPRSLPNIVDNIWCRLRLNLPEQSIPRGKRRIRWTCSCGLRLYDDFDEQFDNGALDDLENRLNTNYLARRSHSESTRPLMNIFLQALGWGSRYVQLFWSHLRGQTIEGGTLPTKEHAPTDTRLGGAPRESELRELLYLLHCNSTGEYGVKLDQDLIHKNLTDRELFRFLNTIYSRARKETKWLTLRTTTNISLCKFYVDHSSHVSILKHGQECMQQQTGECVCLPPRSLVGQEYQCHPTPPDPMPLPPFGKDYLMHYFLNPDCLSPDQVWAYKQLPKRMYGPLRPGCGNFLPGWGIYFEDGWNFKTIYLLIALATLISSLIFGICWSVLKLDVQAAFGITSYWIAVVALGLGFLALRSTDKL